MTEIYLEENPPARRQFRTQRRAEVTGAIVVHTAENTTDRTLPDGGAESVARFISTRTDAPGSYHSIVDSDSVVRLGRYEWEMFHEGTGGNRWSLGLSFACESQQWPRLPEEWVTSAISLGACEAAAMALWVHGEIGVDVPPVKITAEQYKAGKPGFVGHGDLDPRRRTDPGVHFPWRQFLDAYEAEMVSLLTVAPSSLPTEFAGGTTLALAVAEVAELYRTHRAYPSDAELATWRKHLAHLIYEKGEDPYETLQWIEWKLRTDNDR